MKNVLFIGCLYPKENESQFRKNYKVFDSAANVLQWKILRGLDDFCNVSVITTPNVKGGRSIYSRQMTFSHKAGNNKTDLCLGFFNIPFIRQIFEKYSLKKAVTGILSKKEIDVIILYSLSGYKQKLISQLVKKFNGIKTVCIITDLPMYMSANINPVYRILKNIETRQICKQLPDIDGFVLLSEKMRERLPLNGKPFTIVEGIVDDELQVSSIPAKKNDRKEVEIVYTGTLDLRYGIDNLLRAFTSLTNPGYRLIICGRGDGEALITDYQKKDSRIIYKGLLSNPETIALQHNADLLINPRTSEGAFTRYSFPSKTMEYLYSGTPVLIYKLDGIPVEYYKYCFSIDKYEGTSQLADKIDEILSMEKKHLHDIGEKAREFVANNKNPKVQARKIIDLINKL